MLHTATAPRTALPFPLTDEPATDPAAMARHLRQTSPDQARCFARAMHADAAWANEEWGLFWAAVVRLV